jgi:hypothetical protein
MTEIKETRIKSKQTEMAEIMETRIKSKRKGFAMK